jgi:putative ABC transport system permease protein
MNIMYVSVTERTREIGLRMSIGARGMDILWQFLVEAVLISITGGIIGVLLGVTAARLVTVFLSWPTLVSESSIILSFMVCAVTGVFFGYYPAQKASRLDPIEALRYE